MVGFKQTGKRLNRVQPWNYNIRRNVNSSFSNVTMRRVAIIFF